LPFETKTVTLPFGFNTVKLCKSSGYAELDSVEWHQ